MRNKDEISFEICELYKKKNCNKCHGRGYLIYSHPIKQEDQRLNKGEKEFRFGSYCTCVQKGLSKVINGNTP